MKTRMISVVAVVVAITFVWAIPPALAENAIGRLEDRPEDFEAHGIQPGAPEVWEDAQRLKDFKPGNYEWWYMDGHFSNGMMAVITFFYAIDGEGNYVPRVIFNISNEEGVIVDQDVYYKSDEFSTQTDHANTKIGSNYFRSLGGMETYEIFVDPATNNGFGANLRLEKAVPTYRPGTGFWTNNADDFFFAWLCTVPGGKMTGTLTMNGETVEVEGSGYHDHNWGNAPMDVILGDWFWGRAEVEGATVVMASVRFNDAYGNTEAPLLYVAKGDDIIVDAVNDELVFLEGVKVVNPDTGNRINSDTILIVDEEIGQASIRFTGGQVVATSRPDRSSDEWDASYVRFASTTTLDIQVNGHDIQAKGPSVLEYINFYAIKN